MRFFQYLCCSAKSTIEREFHYLNGMEAKGHPQRLRMLKEDQGIESIAERSREWRSAGPSTIEDLKISGTCETRQ